MKLISLMSSGIDSPVATSLISERATKIIIIHADMTPFIEKEEITNFHEISRFLKKSIKKPVEMLIIPNGENIVNYKKNCNNRFTCIFCKRMMLRIGEKIAEKKSASAIVTGDSLGQVASQTLQNIRVIEQTVKIPILRPLIGRDKEEIVDMAKKRNLFELSIKESFDCHAVPKNPSTKAKLDDILNEEKKINIKKMVEKSVRNCKKVTL
ncbi:MAG: hypothetical protein V5A68_04730 [Candidatus Thermoplasmatota archaeon]